MASEHNQWTIDYLWLSYQQWRLYAARLRQREPDLVWSGTLSACHYKTRVYYGLLTKRKPTLSNASYNARMAIEGRAPFERAQQRRYHNE